MDLDGAAWVERGEERAEEHGQAAVELALVLPLVATLLLAVVQVGLVVRDHVVVIDAAREAARAASVDPSPGAADRAILRESGLKVGRVSTETSYNGGVPRTVTVNLRYRSPTDVALIGSLLPDIDLNAKATMWVEF